MGKNDFSIDDVIIIDLKKVCLLRRIFYFYQIKKEMKKSTSDRLHDNYSDLESLLDKSYAFTICVYRREILALSLLTHEPQYGESWARALTRTYYFQKYRQRSTNFLSYPNLASKVMLPYQINQARNLNLDGIFISMQDSRSSKMLGRLAKKLNETTSFKWYISDDLFNTCPVTDGHYVDSEKCWQHVTWIKLKDRAEFKLKAKSEWLRENDVR